MLNLQSIAFALFTIVVDVVVGFNRIDSEQNLYSSLLSAPFYNDDENERANEFEEDDRETAEELNTNQNAKDNNNSVLVLAWFKNSFICWSRFAQKLAIKALKSWTSTYPSNADECATNNKKPEIQHPECQVVVERWSQEKWLLQTDDSEDIDKYEEEEDDEDREYRAEMDKFMTREMVLLCAEYLEYDENA
ncbi:hypothetical protein GCK72_025094 [Caenorhabditis remanei]|uniref:Uncharacterized protein n=1 Tax=Caenorhabditis remanei TaxID=31234 RepID=A0A6A5G0Z9_CAERE|nr:hypothetical protein GCK72_025094 [Caenorhabditis remanei]KAF1748627.1 hypothetical protein GCK72_025094 [Caenorhabditis remanei]